MKMKQRKLLSLAATLAVLSITAPVPVLAGLSLAEDAISKGNVLEIIDPTFDVQSAIDGITDASATNPYLIRLGAGVFDTGSAGLTLKPFVALRGASVQSTIIESTSVADAGTVTMATDTLLEDLTVRNTGGSGDAIGVLGSGQDFKVHSVRIEVTENGASTARGYAGTDDVASPGHSGELSHVEIEIDTGLGIGGQGASGFGYFDALTVRNCHVRVTAAGQGLADPSLFSGSELLVVDSTIEVTGDFVTGVDVTRADKQLYRNVRVLVSGESSSAFSGAGSGFKPVIEDSHIEVTGSGSRAFRSNNGRIHVRRSTIIAPIGLLTFGSSLTGTFRFDQCVFDVSTAFEIHTDGTQFVRVGASKIDASTAVDVQSGAVDAICVASYDENYVALNADCSTPP